MVESSTGINLNNSIRSVVYQGIRILHIHLTRMELSKG
jgi:hypothetical protein